jgi:hypothetical protein
MKRIVFLSCVALAFLVGAEPGDPFDGISYAPTATGIVITRFAPDAQAQQIGLKLGDIITTYAGKPVTTQAELTTLVTAGTNDAPIVVQRGDQVVTVTAKPGKLGVYLTPVEAGKKWELPPDTGVAIASERLKTTPIDTWYAFIIDGKKVGAEHAYLTRTDDRLTITIEVLFDGGEKWGLNHMIETGVLDVSGAFPRVITQVHEGPLWNFRSAGRWKDATTWEVTVDSRKDDGTPEHEILTGQPTGPLINDYSGSYLPSLMPLAAKTCYHTRATVVGDADPSAWSATLVIGPEEITVDEEKITAVRVEQRKLRDIGWISWIKDGEVVKHDYSGGKGTTIAIKATKEKALVGLDPKLVPRTAK